MPMGDADRWSKAAKKRIKVSIPHFIQMYNKYIRGTDRMDENINNNRISIRGKKWWWSIFTWLVDVSIQNAWFLSRQVGNNISHLNFKREIAISYVKRFQNPPKKPGRKPMNLPGGTDSRFDSLHHFVQATANDSKRRCAGELCKSKDRTECNKCSVGLCVRCFKAYHTK